MDLWKLMFHLERNWSNLRLILRMSLFQKWRAPLFVVRSQTQLLMTFSKIETNSAKLSRMKFLKLLQVGVFGLKQLKLLTRKFFRSLFSTTCNAISLKTTTRKLHCWRWKLTTNWLVSARRTSLLKANVTLTSPLRTWSVHMTTLTNRSLVKCKLRSWPSKSKSKSLTKSEKMLFMRNKSVSDNQLKAINLI